MSSIRGKVLAGVRIPTHRGAGGDRPRETLPPAPRPNPRERGRSMGHAVWKYPLSINREQSIELPRGASPLAVEVQHDQLCLWAMVDPEAETAPRTVWVHGTGHPIEGHAE